jgi:hypothetical protein
MNGSHWRRGCAVLLTVSLILIVGACTIVGASVQHGALRPPWFDRRLGMVRLVGYSTWNANCPPYVGCAPTRREAYVIWLLVERPAYDAASHSSFRFVSLPIEHNR